MGKRNHMTVGEYAKKWGWQMFNVNLACGALSVVISSIPYSFKGQHAIGSIFFIANIVVYILNLIMTLIRFWHHTDVWRNSFYDQKEAVWFPVPTIALNTLLVGTMIYGIPYTGEWLVVACEIWFYIYMVWAAAVALIVQNTLRQLSRDIQEIGPPDALEVYPLMFIGVAGSTLVKDLVDISPSRALTIAIFSYFAAGLGFFMGLLKLAVWMHRDMTSKVASPDVIPSYLISVGVAGFPSLILMNLASIIEEVYEKNNFLSGLDNAYSALETGRIFAVTSVLITFLLMGMAAWLLLIFIGFVIRSIIENPKQGLWERWQFTWWSWTFPLTGVVVSMGRFGTYLPSKAFGVLNIIFVIGMACVWCVNTVGTVRMLWKGELPGSSQDLEENDALQEAENGSSPSVHLGA